LNEIIFAGNMRDILAGRLTIVLHYSNWSEVWIFEATGKPRAHYSQA
jgi:hypothetical protein